MWMKDRESIFKIAHSPGPRWLLADDWELVQGGYGPETPVAVPVGLCVSCLGFLVATWVKFQE